MQKATPLSSCEEKAHSRSTFIENTISNLPKVLVFHKNSEKGKNKPKYPP